MNFMNQHSRRQTCQTTVFFVLLLQCFSNYVQREVFKCAAKLLKIFKLAKVFEKLLKLLHRLIDVYFSFFTNLPSFSFIKYIYTS
jgi:hypothetical protein